MGKGQAVGVLVIVGEQAAVGTEPLLKWLKIDKG